MVSLSRSTQLKRENISDEDMLNYGLSTFLEYAPTAAISRKQVFKNTMKWFHDFSWLNKIKAINDESLISLNWFFYIP